MVADTFDTNEPAVEVAIPARQPTPAQLRVRFTPENAREMVAKRMAKAAERKEREREALAREAMSDESYKGERLARVRKQLAKLDSLLEKETDPQKLDRLASAQYRLSEQERILAGRPLPGSHRPTRNSNKSAPISFTPTE